VVRDIISHDAQLCVTRCGGIETTQHLVISCSCFTSMWGLVWAWLGTSAADPFNLCISSRLFILQVVCEFVVLLCNMFGFVACGFYGM